MSLTSYRAAPPRVTMIRTARKASREAFCQTGSASDPADIRLSADRQAMPEAGCSTPTSKRATARAAKMPTRARPVIDQGPLTCVNGSIITATVSRLLQCLATTYSSGRLSGTVPSALPGFTAEFEMGSGGSLTLWSPSNGAGANRQPCRAAVSVGKMCNRCLVG